MCQSCHYTHPCECTPLSITVWCFLRENRHEQLFYYIHNHLQSLYSLFVLYSLLLSASHAINFHFVSLIGIFHPSSQWELYGSGCPSRLHSWRRSDWFTEVFASNSQFFGNISACTDRLLKVFHLQVCMNKMAFSSNSLRIEKCLTISFMKLNLTFMFGVMMFVCSNLSRFDGFLHVS